jgi:RHS repeat-associated protein
MTDALGHAFRYGYAGHLLVRETDRTGFNFYFQWQGEGEAARCVRTWGDGGVLGRQITYEPNVTRVVDSLGHTTVYEHDGARAVRTIDPRGAVTSARYEHGQPVESTDALGRVTRFTYDERGNRVTETRPDGTTWWTTYDERDQEVEVVDPLGGRWKLERDARGQLVARTNPLGQTTRFYYSGGLLRAVEDAAGQPTRLEYDAHANLVELASPDGTSLRWQYDVLGMPVLTQDAAGNFTRLTYDLLGRLRREASADEGVRELEYDEQGRLTHLSDRERDVRFAYRGMGVLAERSEGGTSVRFEYDTEEDLVGVVNELGLEYRFVRDAAGSVVVEAAYDGVSYRYEYDLAHRLTRIVYASGSTSEFRYDDGDRPVLSTHSDGEELRFSYRADGAMLTAENRHASLAFELDALGRVLEERQGKEWLRYEYDALGRRIRLRSSRGIDQRIGRDALGRVTELRATTGTPSADAHPLEYVTSFVRDALGNELARSLPGQAESRLGRDRSGRALRHEVISSRGTVGDRTHVWDAAGRLSRLVDRVHGATDFTHDPLGRLVSAQRGGERFELRLADAAGNLFRRADRGDRRYGPSGQLLEALLADGSVVSHAYDAEGRLREKRRQGGDTWRYAWSTQSYLTEVVRPDGSRVRFDYDPFGRRIAKHFGGRTTRFLWDGDVPLHEWVEGAAEAAVTWLFEPESFTPVAKLTRETRESIVCDDLGTPILLLDAEGQPTWSAEHTIYGELRATPSERQSVPFRFAGQYEDSETGLFYNRFRYYDPESGQYTSPDPLGLFGGTAPYAYVPDPLAWIDPLGLRYWGRAGRTFSRRITFTPSTGRTYVVFQRGDVDWNQVRTGGPRAFRGRTNIEAARAGLAPQLPNGYLVTIHHAEQNARGPWFEVSREFHHIGTARQPPLHPYRGRQHPLSPIGRGRGSLRYDFHGTEQPEYWRFRAADIDAGGGP